MTEAPHSPEPADERLTDPLTDSLPDPLTDPLTDREKSLLDFERSWWSHGTDRDAAIREHLSLSPTDYHRALNDLIDKPAALEYDGVLVRRLRRQRDARRTQRSTGRR